MKIVFKDDREVGDLKRQVSSLTRRVEACEGKDRYRREQLSQIEADHVRGRDRTNVPYGSKNCPLLRPSSTFLMCF